MIIGADLTFAQFQKAPLQFAQLLGDFLLPGPYQLGALHFRFAHCLLRARDILDGLTTLTNQPGFFALQGKQARQAFKAHA
ncbi:MAG: hypothetical protein ACKO54_19670, partial [Alphaproteobacteria bacterium]